MYKCNSSYSPLVKQVITVISWSQQSQVNAGLDSVFPVLLEQVPRPRPRCSLPLHSIQDSLLVVVSNDGFSCVRVKCAKRNTDCTCQEH